MAIDNIPDINSSNIDTIVSDWITNVEAKAILDKLSSITEPLPTNLDKVRTDLREINNEKKELSEQTKQDLKKLLLIVESNNDWKEKLSSWETFIELNESVSEKSKIMEKLFSITDIYFDDKLKVFNLSNTEKENAKLVLWDNLINKVNFEWWMWLIVKSINWKISDLLNGVETWNWEKDDFKNISTVVDNLTKIQDDLLNKSDNENWNKLFRTIDELLWYNFKNIEKAKSTNIKFNTLENTFMAINWDSKDIKTFDDIKNVTLEKAKSFDWLKQSWDQIKWLFDKLPADWWNQIKEFLKEVSNEYPILWFIISLFLGDWFLNWSDKKSKDSVDNLVLFVEKQSSESSFKKLWVGELKWLDPKELEKFHKYLDSKDIDYTKEDFWKWILLWKTNDNKVLEVYNILKDEDWNTLWKDMKLDSFVSKLNWISKLASQREDEELEKLEKEVAQEPKIPVNTKSTEVKIVEPKADNTRISDEKIVEAKILEPKIAKPVKPIEIPEIVEKKGTSKPIDTSKSVESTETSKTVWQTTESIARMNILKLNRSIRRISSLPAYIDYDWKSLKLNIENNNIVIWENKYKISIQALWREQFDSIKFINGNFILNDKLNEPIEKDQLTSIVQDLLKKSSYNFEWKSWFVNYTWIMSKIV